MLTFRRSDDVMVGYITCFQRITVEGVLYIAAVFPLLKSHLHPTEAMSTTESQKRRLCNEHSLLSEQQNMSFVNFYVSDKYKFVFCNTPKVASTSWQLALTRLYVKQASVVKFYNLIRQRTSEFMQYGYHLQADEMLQRLKTHYKFMIAREPLERLLSAYRMFFVKKIKSGFGFAARRRVKSKVKGNIDIQYRPTTVLDPRLSKFSRIPWRVV